MSNQVKKEMIKHLVSSGLSHKKARKVMGKVKSIDASASCGEIWINYVLPAIKQSSVPQNVVIA